MATKTVGSKLNESAIQRQIVMLLRAVGYVVMETGKSRSRQTCSRCGNKAYATGWQGNTVGLPDLYIHSSKWPRGYALAIELKTPTGAIRKEQEEYANLGIIYICRSVSCVINTLINHERELGNDIQVESLEKIRDINGI